MCRSWSPGHHRAQDLITDSFPVLSGPAATLLIVECHDRLARVRGHQPDAVRSVPGRRLIVPDSGESVDDLVRVGTAVGVPSCVYPRVASSRTTRVLDVVSGGQV